MDGVVATAVADPAAIVLKTGRRSNIPDALIATMGRADDVAAYTPGGDLKELPVPVPTV